MCVCVSVCVCDTSQQEEACHGYPQRAGSEDWVVAKQCFMGSHWECLDATATVECGVVWADAKEASWVWVRMRVVALLRVI